MTVLVRAIVSIVAVLVLFAGSAAGQDEPERSLQAVVAEALLEDGYWDETGVLDESELEGLVDEFGEEFTFAFTERSFEVQGEPTQNPVLLLSQAVLDQLGLSEGPDTVLFVSGDHVGGATNTFPFFNVTQVMADFDRSNPVEGFRASANDLLALGNELAPVVEGAADQTVEGSELVDGAATETGETGIFAGMRLLLILAIVTAALALASVISSRNKRVRRAVTTADARSSTKDELQAMSDLILDLDPRVTLADDSKLKERFVEASTTYREVLEQADQAETGHEVADLRIAIAKARWKLDVIDSELSGRTPPKEPFTRDNSGSAWDSTRGSGNNR